MADQDVIVEAIDIRVEDKASHPAAQIAQRLQAVDTAAVHAQKSSGLLGNAFNSLKGHAFSLLASTTGLTLGLGALVQKAYAANKEFGAVRKQVVSTHFAFQNWRKDASVDTRLDYSIKQSTKTLEEFERVEERLAIPMESLGATYEKLAAVGFQKFGMSQEQVLRLTERAAEVSKVLGISTEHAAQTMSRLLQSKMLPERSMDKLTIFLRNTMLHGTKGAAALKKMSDAEVLGRLEKGIAQISKGADRMSQGLGDQIFRIKDFFDDFLRDVGSPVFKAIVDRFKQWQEKLTANGKTMKEIATEWGKRIVELFEKAEKLVTAILEHWKTLAVLWAASKAPAWLESLKGLTGGTGILNPFNKVGVGGFVGALQGAVPALALLTAAASAAADAINETHEAQLKRRGEADVMVRALQSASRSHSANKRLGGLLSADAATFPGGMSMTSATKQALESERLSMARATIGIAKSTGALDARGNLNMQVLTEQFSKMPRAVIEQYGASLGVSQFKYGNKLSSDDVAERFAQLVTSMQKLIQPIATPAEKSPLAKGKPPVNNFYGGIHITQDFKDQDPDRVFVAFKQGLEMIPEKHHMANVQADAFAP